MYFFPGVPQNLGSPPYFITGVWDSEALICYFNAIVGFMVMFLKTHTHTHTHTQKKRDKIWKKTIREELTVTAPSVLSSLWPPSFVLPPFLSLIPPELVFQIFLYQAQ